LPKVLWSQRDNNNYEETGLLTSLHYFTENRELFLKNFYLKSKRSIMKPQNEGPAAYVFPADDSRPGGQCDLLKILQKQGCEIARATAAFTVTLPAKKPPKRPATAESSAGGSDAASDQSKPSETPASQAVSDQRGSGKEKEGKQAGAPTSRQFPAGSYVVRMDQPYSRIADSFARLSVLESRRSAENSLR
jgi:hypothetical protein